MSPLSTPSAAAAAPPDTVFAEAFRSGLYDRILDRTVGFQGRSWQCLHLAHGTVTRLLPEGEQAVSAPALVWSPRDEAPRLRAQAGSNGTLLVIGETMLANAIGHKPEAAALRLMSARRFTLALAPHPRVAAGIAACMATIQAEHDSAQAGREAIIEAQIRIMLVLLWRAGVSAVVQDSRYTQANLTLERFRHLVEAHLRDRWPVARFADELGISPDRLHDICVRTLGTPPQQLVQDRLAQEAQALLQRSHQTLDQIAGYLGFRSTPQFSAFFRKRTGLPPGAFRKAVMRRDAALPMRTYADWP